MFPAARRIPGEKYEVEQMLGGMREREVKYLSGLLADGMKGRTIGDYRQTKLFHRIVHGNLYTRY